MPWDLGDPLLNCWILAWHFHQAGRLLHGDLGAFADWWHPNIFHPSPYGLGQSELLVAQALQGAPIYALTGNILLTYNLLFLSSFVLAALGAFLLVRSLTRDTSAGFVAGLLYGFALYRVNQGPHLQVLSSQWFPFVLWGLHEWWQHGRLRHAAMAGVALALQNLSNGYFLVYAALWLPPYVLAQMALRGRLRDRRAWLGPARLRRCRHRADRALSLSLRAAARARAAATAAGGRRAVQRRHLRLAHRQRATALLGIAPADARAPRGRSLSRRRAAAARARGARPGWPAPLA